MPKDRIQEIIKKHKNQKGALTQTLLEIQKELNITLKEATQEISKQLNIPTIEIFRIQNEEEIENEFLEGTKDENLGVYNELFSAKSHIEGQDGGIVTSLLVKGIKEGVFDSAIVVQRRSGYTAEAVVAENINDVIAARKTKYLKIDVVTKLREAINQGKKKIAIVCTPCQVRTIRKIQQGLKQKSPDIEISIIGLFCLEAFNSVRLEEEIKQRLNVDLDMAEKTQISKGKFTIQLKGQEYSYKIKDLKNVAEKGCHYCSDFTSKLADISVGSVGSQSGYSTVIVRSNAGKRLLKDLDVAKKTVETEEVIKLSKFKKERAQKNFVASNKQQSKN